MDENRIYLRELFSIIAQNLRKISLIALAFVGFAVIYLLIASPVYESESLMRIKQPQGIATSLLEVVPGRSEGPTNQLMSTYAEILKSRSVIEPVIAATEEMESGKNVSYENYVKERVMTTPIKNTEIMKVAFYASTPEIAKKANELGIAGFLNRLNELSRTEQKMTKEFISGRVGEAQKELYNAETALQEFKEKNKIIEPSESTKAIGAKVAWIDQGMAENSVNLATAQARLAAIDAQLSTSGKAISDSTTIKLYNQKLAELEMTKVSYLGKYTDKHPKVIEVNAEIESTRNQLQGEIDRVASLQTASDNVVQQSLIAAKFQSEAEIAVANAKARAISTLENINGKTIEAMPGVEQSYLRLARNANVAQEIYVMLAKRLEEAKVAEAMVSTEVQVVDNPTLPREPVQPKKTLTISLALLMGLVVGSVYTLSSALLNRTIRTKEEVESFLDLPVLGTVPDGLSLNKVNAEINKNPSILEKLRRVMEK
ncbi:MAG: GumC family protein [Acidaminococcaceae bacterium]